MDDYEYYDDEAIIPLVIDQYLYSLQQMMRQSERAAANPGAKVIDTSKLVENDIYGIVRRDAGLLRGQRSSVNISCALRQRELGQRVKRSHTLSGVVPSVNAGLVDRPVRGHGFCGQFSEDGSVFMHANQDQRIRLYNYSCGEFTKHKEIEAEDISWSIIDTAYSPDQACLAYSTWSNCVQLCNIYGDTTHHEALDLAPEHAGGGYTCFFSLVFAPDSTELLASCSDCCLYVYDLNSRQRTLKVEAHTSDVNSVCWMDGGGELFLSASDDGLCKMWDRRLLGGGRSDPVGVFVGHVDGLTHVTSKGDGRYVLTNGKDQRMKLWDARVMHEGTATLPPAPERRNFDYRGFGEHFCPRFATHPSDMSVMTYTGHCVLQTLIRCYFSPPATTGQRYVYSGSANNSVYVYDLLSGEVVRKLSGHSAAVRDVAWHPSDPVLVSTSWDGTNVIWGVDEMSHYTDAEIESGCCRSRFGGDVDMSDAQAGGSGEGGGSDGDSDDSGDVDMLADDGRTNFAGAGLSFEVHSDDSLDGCV